MNTIRNKTIPQTPARNVIPFYTFNDAMTAEEIRAQIDCMAKAGVGGVFVHARSGLTATYLGEEWFALVDAVVTACAAADMEVWIYDEFGWPSGIADGGVLTGEENCIHWLEYDAASKNVCIGGCTGYVDVFNIEATRRFLTLTHRKYYERYGNKIKGFFTDEPQYGLHHVPYSPVLAAAYKARTGRDVSADAESLFCATPESARVRDIYYSLAGALFLQNYVQPLADWCALHGYALTGHYLEEKKVSLQVESAGDLLKLYRAMQSPGMDWLGKKAGTDDAAPKQISSVCRQFGKADSIAETYACAGYGAQADELKNIADWELMGGINRLCMVFPYSFRGRRKRDYPSGLMPGSPLFALADTYFSYINRLSDMVRRADDPTDVLVLLPLHAAMRAFGNGAEAEKVDALYADTLRALRAAHVSYHIGNVDIVRENGRAENGKLHVGNCIYDTVLQLDGDNCSVLEAFAKDGKLYVVTPDTLPSVIANLADKAFIDGDNKAVAVSRYVSEGVPVLIARNTTYMPQTVTFTNKAGENFRELLLERGVCLPPRENGNTVRLKPLETRVFALADEKPVRQTEEYIIPDRADWRIVREDKNAVLLDTCVPVIDGREYPPMTTVALNELLLGKRTCALCMRFTVYSEMDLTDVALAVEDGEKFQIYVNGALVPTVSGTYLRQTFATYKIMLRAGENTVELRCDYAVSAAAANALHSAESSESDFNRVRDTFDIENVYVLGAFGVKSQSMRIQKNFLVHSGAFTLCAKEPVTDTAHISRAGRPFFTGNMRLQKSIRVHKKAGVRYLLDMQIRGLAARVSVNGKRAATFFWNGRPYDVTDCIRDGENKLTVEIYTDLRNLFGPFHNKYGNPDMVGFTTFTAAPGWCDPQENFWTDDWVTQEIGFSFVGDAERNEHGACR